MQVPKRQKNITVIVTVTSKYFIRFSIRENRRKLECDVGWIGLVGRGVLAEGEQRLETMRLLVYRSTLRIALFCTGNFLIINNSSPLSSSIKRIVKMKWREAMLLVRYLRQASDWPDDSYDSRLETHQFTLQTNYILREVLELVKHIRANSKRSSDSSLDT